MQAPNGGLRRACHPDLSAVVTGILAGITSCNMPVWMTLIGCFVAIVITKTAFGGIGKTFSNPALAGRVFLFISFPGADDDLGSSAPV